MPTPTINALRIHCDRPGSIYRRGQLGNLLKTIRVNYGSSLGCERPYVRDQGTFFFVSPDAQDTLLFPVGHDLEGQDRYTWSPDPNDPCVDLGVLVAVNDTESLI